MKDIECPYCEYEFNYDGDGLGQDETTEYQCPECDKCFMIMASWDVSYHCTKCDCLNGGEHKYKTRNISKGNLREQCEMCDKQNHRDATPEDIEKYIKYYGEDFRKYAEKV